MKRIPARTAAAQVVRDLEIDNPANKIYTMIEWSREALALINTSESFIHKECNLDINNYKAELPMDCVRVIDIKIGDTFPEHTSRSFREFHKVTEKNMADANISASYHNLTSPGTNNKTKFTIDNGFIHLSLDTGTVGLSYQALPYDDDGEPTIDLSHLEAVTAYLKYMFLQSRAYSGKLPMGIYKDAEQRWQQLCGEARGRSAMPTRAEMDRLGAIWNNFIQWKNIRQI